MDRQDERFLHWNLTPAMIASGFADPQDYNLAVIGKILCTLRIDVIYDKNIDFPASAHGRGGGGKRHAP